MDVGSIDHASAIVTAPARAGATSINRGAPQQPPGSGDDSRLSAVVELIEAITGRKVALVPPTAYLVSAPPADPSERRPIELVVPDAVVAEERSKPGELEVDVSSILRRGASDRMILLSDADGGLALHPAVDLEL